MYTPNYLERGEREKNTCLDFWYNLARDREKVRKLFSMKILFQYLHTKQVKYLGTRKKNKNKVCR